MRHQEGVQLESALHEEGPSRLVQFTKGLAGLVERSSSAEPMAQPGVLWAAVAAAAATALMAAGGVTAATAAMVSVPVASAVFSGSHLFNPS